MFIVIFITPVERDTENSKYTGGTYVVVAQKAMYVVQSRAAVNSEYGNREESLFEIIFF